MKALLLLCLMMAVGCATRTRQTDRLVKDHGLLPNEAHIKHVPHVTQPENHCGPASMAMVLKYVGRSASAKELAKSMMTPKLKGTFQADMLLAARRQGMLTLPMRDMKQILTEVSQGNPIIVFQNLGLSFIPQWHYAVVTGHNLSGPDIYLHSGKKIHDKIDMRFFERSWIMGGRWALLVLPPGKLSTTTSELDHLRAISFLEELKDFSAARLSYQAILKKWPTSLAAHIGLGNVTYQLGFKEQSLLYLQKAVAHHPSSAIAWHNLATVQGELKKIKDARASAQKAFELADEETRNQFAESLKGYL